MRAPKTFQDLLCDFSIRISCYDTSSYRIIANLDLPYPWAQNLLPKKLDLYAVTSQEFANAKTSYDVLVTTVSEGLSHTLFYRPV